jgi:ABC-type transport system involved in cytochrome bd biosynthesis fused ATPase/permease subunit
LKFLADQENQISCFLHHGEVREIGSHAELMERHGIYHRLYQLQYEREALQLPPHDHAPKILG